MLSSLTVLMKALRVAAPSIQQQAVRNYAVPKRKMIRKPYFVYKPKMKSRYKGNPNPRFFIEKICLNSSCFIFPGPFGIFYNHLII